MFFPPTEVVVLATGSSSRRALSRRQLYPPHLVPSYSTLHLEKLQAFWYWFLAWEWVQGSWLCPSLLGLTLGHTLMLHPSHGITHPLGQKLLVPRGSGLRVHLTKVTGVLSLSGMCVCLCWRRGC